MRERRLIVPVSPELLPGALRVVERALADTRYLAGALDALRSAVHRAQCGRARAAAVESDARMRDRAA